MNSTWYVLVIAMLVCATVGAASELAADYSDLLALQADELGFEADTLDEAELQIEELADSVVSAREAVDIELGTPEIESNLEAPVVESKGFLSSGAESIASMGPDLTFLHEKKKGLLYAKDLCGGSINAENLSSLEVVAKGIKKRAGLTTGSKEQEIYQRIHSRLHQATIRLEKSQRQLASMGFPVHQQTPDTAIRRQALAVAQGNLQQDINLMMEDFSTIYEEQITTFLEKNQRSPFTGEASQLKQSICDILFNAHLHMVQIKYGVFAKDIKIEFQ